MALHVKPTAIIRWLDGTESPADLPNAEVALVEFGDRVGWLQRFSVKPLVYRHVDSGPLTATSATTVDEAAR